MTYDMQTPRRHFDAARATANTMRLRKLQLETKLSTLSPASLEWRHVHAELLGVENMLRRAESSMAQRRRELERAEAK